MSVEEDGTEFIRLLQTRSNWTSEARDVIVAWHLAHRLQLPEGQALELERWMALRLGDYRGAKMRFAGLLEPQSWLSHYLDYTSYHEAAEMFHFWVGVSMLGAAIGRRVWFDQSYFRVHCNHFIILVGPTGVRKTAAADIGVELLQKGIPGYSLIYEKVTPEALLESLSRNRHRRDIDGLEYCEAMVYAPELAVFLGKQTYNESLVPLITSVADSKEHPMDYLTKHHGKFRLPRATLTVLGCSTPQWLADALPQSAHTGGFMGRFVFAVRDARERLSAFPERPSADLKRYLIDYLSHLCNIEAVISQTPEAKEWCEDWYNKFKITGDTYLAGFHERKQSHLIRLATVMMFAEDPQARQLTTGLYERALAALNETEKYMPEAFAQVEQSDEGRLNTRVLIILRSAGGWIPRSTLLRMTYKTVGSARRLSEVLLTLEQAGLVEVTISGASTNYRATAKAATVNLDGGDPV